MILYLLDHRNWIDDEYYDTKFIGIYSSKSKALSTIEKFSQLPGFRDFKTGFHIETAKIKFKNKIMKKVYLLTINKVLDGDEDEITISYSVCPNIIFARVLWIIKSIISCGKHQKVYVQKYTIDEDEWREGFITFWDKSVTIIKLLRLYRVGLIKNNILQGG